MLCLLLCSDRSVLSLSLASKQAEELLDLVREREERLAKRLADRTIPTREGLNSQRGLLLISMRLNGYVREREKAQAELARLMGLAPGTRFNVTDTGIPHLTAIPEFDSGKLQREAILKRPELYQEDLEERIHTVEHRLLVQALCDLLCDGGVGLA